MMLQAAWKAAFGREAVIRAFSSDVSEVGIAAVGGLLRPRLAASSAHGASLTPRPQGNGGGHRKLAGVTGWIEARIADKGEITLGELAAELAETHGIEVHRGTVWRALRELGLTHKKRPSGT